MAKEPRISRSNIRGYNGMTWHDMDTRTLYKTNFPLALTQKQGASSSTDGTNDNGGTEYQLPNHKSMCLSWRRYRSGTEAAELRKLAKTFKNLGKMTTFWRGDGGPSGKVLGATPNVQAGPPWLHQAPPGLTNPDTSERISEHRPTCA